MCRTYHRVRRQAIACVMRTRVRSASASRTRTGVARAVGIGRPVALQVEREHVGPDPELAPPARMIIRTIECDILEHAVQGDGWVRLGYNRG